MIDKESVIIKYLDEKLSENYQKIEELKKSGIDRDDMISRLNQKLDEVYERVNIQRENKKAHVREVLTEVKCSKSKSETDYNKLYENAFKHLSERGLDPEQIDYHNLVPEDVLMELEAELNLPLPRKEKWVKADYVAAFIAASIGSLADFILSNRNNSLTGKNSDFSKWLNKFHQHEGGAPIDYQGPGFGGGYHRGLSKGHDVLRFIEAILMFKNGQFEGIRFTDGVGKKIVSNINQNGTLYQELGWIEAILKYTKHMFADLVSTCSLPFPGSSFLVESSNRELRKLAATMYHNGFNLKNIMTQSLSAILVEIILRVYFGIQSMNKLKNIELEEDYSNVQLVKEFINPISKEKLFEMLLLSHSIVSGVNIGKVVIKKSPWEINVAEIISVVRYAVPVVKSAVERNSEYSKILRNSDHIHSIWEELSSSLHIELVEIDFSEQICMIE